MSKKTALVGYTGFVGSNLCRSASFDFLANSKNVQQLYGVKPDVLIYAGVTGTNGMLIRIKSMMKQLLGQQKKI